MTGDNRKANPLWWNGFAVQNQSIVWMIQLALLRKANPSSQSLNLLASRFWPSSWVHSCEISRIKIYFGPWSHLCKNRCERWSFWMTLMLGRSFSVSTRRSHGNEKSTPLEHFSTLKKESNCALTFAIDKNLFLLSFEIPWEPTASIYKFFNISIV